MDYLRSIEYHEFPMRVTDPRGLECLRVLAAAELVEVAFTVSPETGLDTAAAVQRITTGGRVALARYMQGKPFA